jgi:hypothetical protein
MSAYAVAHLRRVNVGPEIVEYIARIDATLEPYDGRFLIHGGPVDRWTASGRGISWSSSSRTLRTPMPGMPRRSTRPSAAAHRQLGRCTSSSTVADGYRAADSRDTLVPAPAA